MLKWLLLIGAFLLCWLFLAQVFRGDLIVRSTILKFGRFELRYYSVLILSGIILSYYLARTRAKKEKIILEQLDELIFYSVIFGIVGARLFYVIFNWRFYQKNPLEIFMVWHGGLAIQGAVVFAIITFILYTRFKKNVTFATFQILDLGAAYLPLGQAIGRWGNFFNYEAFGTPTDLPWKMYVPTRFRPFGYASFEYFHPTFLYESIWDLLVFLLLTRYMNKYRKNFGEVFSLYLCFYSLGRICIERLRLDSLYWGDLRTAQLFSAIMIFIGFGLFLLRRGGLN
ncbi:MAG TPA: prolipoprotein diacylglyceryl transferase [Pseudothermotoga sp.]|nr:prolipoprotein diacylglyceryl transferase [Pseudothermotoga sp.]HOK83118.1 prolipoprotein diacylglyceryl transferase [Pseudothermotoga sp.]HPP69711.1 prolipoprotein diacylglyceryl transferase [Pseudothermotoga sp.]